MSQTIGGDATQSPNNGQAPRRPGRQPWTAEQKAEAATRRAQGKTPAATAASPAPVPNAAPPQPAKRQMTAKQKASAKAGAKKAAATRAANKLAAAQQPGATATIVPSPARQAAMTARANASTEAPPPLMLDLVRELPASGSNYSIAAQEAWLTGVKGVFGIIYPPIAQAA